MQIIDLNFSTSYLPFIGLNIDMQCKVDSFLTRIDFEKASSLSTKLRVEGEKMPNVDSFVKPILPVPKGKYFKNNKTLDKSTDIEMDGPIFIPAIKQWWWKDSKEEWYPFPKGENERINQCYERYPKSTVVVSIQNQS